MIDSTLIFAPNDNTKGRHDATGAFQPEARRFAAAHGCVEPLTLIVNKGADKASMREDVLARLSTCEGLAPLYCVAFFCHGYRRGIQLGFDNGNVARLAKAIAAVSKPDVRVPLYACDTGRDADQDRKDDLAAFGGDGGFADQLRDALCRHGCVDCVVYAHTTPGHATRNPYVRIFPGNGSPVGGTGGSWVVAPGSSLWRAWRVKLREGNLRYEFPFMSVADVHRYLQAG